MKKLKLIILLFAWLLICSNVYAQPKLITNFDTLMQSLKSGEKVRVVINYSQCKLFIDKKEQPLSPDAVSGLDISTFEYFAPGAANNKMAFVVFSESKLIKNPIGKGYVFNYGKVRINADNTVKITAQYLNPGNFKVIMDESFECEIYNSNNNGGVYLFRQ